MLTRTEPTREENWGTEELGAREAECSWWIASLLAAATQGWNQTPKNQTRPTVAGPLKSNNNIFSARKQLIPNIENCLFQIATLKLFEIIRHTHQIVTQEIRNRRAKTSSRK